MADSENLNLNIASSSEYDREQQRLRLEEQKALQEREVQRQIIAELQEQLAMMAEHEEDLMGKNKDLSARLETSLGFTTKENEEDKGSDNFKDRLRPVGKRTKRNFGNYGRTKERPFSQTRCQRRQVNE